MHVFFPHHKTGKKIEIISQVAKDGLITYSLAYSSHQSQNRTKVDYILELYLAFLHFLIRKQAKHSHHTVIISQYYYSKSIFLLCAVELFVAPKNKNKHIRSVFQRVSCQSTCMTVCLHLWFLWSKPVCTWSRPEVKGSKVSVFFPWWNELNYRVESILCKVLGHHKQPEQLHGIDAPSLWNSTGKMFPHLDNKDIQWVFRWLLIICHSLWIKSYSY